MTDHWIAERMRGIEVSGIRKVFDLAANLKDPVNLSIGQPHFPVPEPIKAAAKKAIDDDKNGYTVTQGIAPLRDRIVADQDNPTAVLRGPGVTAFGRSFSLDGTASFDPNGGQIVQYVWTYLGPERIC